MNLEIKNGVFGVKIVLAKGQTPIWGSGAFVKKALLGAKNTFESAFQVFGKYHPIKLGIELLVLKALLEKAQFGAFKIALYFNKQNIKFNHFILYCELNKEINAF